MAYTSVRSVRITIMSATNGHGPSESAPPRGLRTGKIHTTKGSASEILRTLGVKPSEIKAASRMLSRPSRSSAARQFVSETSPKPRSPKGQNKVKG
jgi:hypothetical protein